jgi:tRNA threonylcarbamoyladenosine biosynthesis protein TsaE
MSLGGEIIALEGDLGTGKTCLTQGIGKGLGIKVPITSPTFVLVNEYEGRLALYHLDMYRVSNHREALDFGVMEYLHTATVCVIEWAERIASILPKAHIWITMEHMDDDLRQITIEAKGQRYCRMLERLKELDLEADGTGED